ncbi:Riboflavin transporter [Pseudovibrio axinellae]|uniref:Riboflavin transporter n=1 Tax=Pseudovibrio axinellae TaxID=989403 RepID=A0A165YCF5_9HYPH|nr:DMT family transporter [Pseudovibrio axinellae]KZL18714.1 Riboflavin transporter [Pseudovibrio axinellae]SEP95637.1 Threonine/homoserine efflux transporter RhtA [Pseudovibrio axinellae]
MTTITTGAPANHTSNAELHGILLMVAGMSLAPLMDGIAKYLSEFISPVEVSLGRFACQALIVLVIAFFMRRSFGSLLKEMDRIQFIRGACLAICSIFFFTSLKYMPLADAIAIFFVQPMILTVLSAVVLKEKVGVRRWAAVVVGMVGALIIIRPGSSALGLPSLLPLAAATCFAIYLVLTRKLSGKASLLGIQFATGVAGVLTLIPLVVISSLLGIEAAAWTTPELSHLPLFLLMGIISFTSHGFIVLAFDRLPASVLAPLGYTEIISATIVGYVLFGDIPDKFVWLGVALIAGGGLYIAHRERTAAKRQAESEELVDSSPTRHC